MTLSCSNTTVQKLAVLLVVALFWVGKSVWREREWISADPEMHPRLSEFDHFLVHISKSGGSYAFDKLIEMLQSLPQWKALPQSERPMICDGRMRRTSQFEKYYPYYGQKAKYRCNFWMAEQPYTSLAKANYIIVRSPREHVLSQYFHCKESINHYDRWKYMPPLEEWLQAWVDALGNQTQAKLNSKFHCFDPRNLQSYFATTTVDHGKELPSLQDIQTQLSEKFAVVGDNARMHETICLTMIRYTNGWIPSECTCQQRRLKIHFYGHGVRHHGSSFPTTPHQDQLLEQLTSQDELLYQAAQQVFQQQLEQAQVEYGIQLC